MSKLVKGVTSALGFGADDAARDATNAQMDATNASIGLQRESRDLARQDLMPYQQFGQGLLPQFGQLMSTQGQQNYLASNPMFQAALRNSNREMMAAGAAGGRAGSGDMASALFDRYLSMGDQYIGNQFNRLASGVNIGQSSAAGQTANGLAAGQNIANATSNLGNIQSAGIMAQQNAQAGLGSKLLGAGMGAAFGSGMLGGAGLAGGGLAGGALGGLLAFSDRRMKRNIVNVGSDHHGNIYEFDYAWGGRYRGRMADELQQVRPDAVREVDGVLMVTQEFAPEKI